MDGTLEAEVVRGLGELDEFLGVTAAFQDWCRENPEQAPVVVAATRQRSGGRTDSASGSSSRTSGRAASTRRVAAACSSALTAAATRSGPDALYEWLPG